ncbi:semaphorin-1A-like isoform X2 [Asterias rubens]|uniref:semaphorin-1A-like isoform X2 n=1 Tax=Asterias rubens TaxID=7604 RepID=UPI00145526EB|nr:semaphorin-1A-like isoform X2 [Asterias rubens]
MERLLTETRLVNRIALALLLTFISSCTGSSIFLDQEPKLVTNEDYHTKLNTFRGESLTAMSLSADRRKLNLGAKNKFYIVDLSQPFGELAAVTVRTWNSSRSDTNSCLMKGKQNWQCQNFIQVVLKNDGENRLMVCGTNAWAPQCRYYQPNSLDDFQPISGSYRCPFSPMQRSTALFAESSLYTATVTSFTAVDSAIMRSVTGPQIRTKVVDTKWLKVPEFINSFEVGDWVMFFFREIAVEHVNSGEAIYSRVAKVCKSDQGGDWVADGTFTTFQKARLNCSFPGAFPFYFNYLQDVSMVGEGENITFYGVFTTGDHEIPGSAVCAFSLKTISAIFNDGQFKEQQMGAWYPVPEDDVPKQRPGNCSQDSTRQQDATLNFILEHPLMHQSVPNKGNDWPRFDMTRSDNRLVQLVVHQQVGEHGKTYDVMFLGTDDGRVLKTVIVKGADGIYHSNLLEEIFVSPRENTEGVVNMEIIRNDEGKEVILVNTNSTVVELPLQRCSNLTKCACVQDPYCVLNNLSEMCVPFDGSNSYDTQDVDNIKDCPKEVIVATTAISCTGKGILNHCGGKDCDTDGDLGDNDKSDNLATTILPTSSAVPPNGATTSWPTRPNSTTAKKGTTPETTEGYSTPSPSPRLVVTTISNEILPGKTTTQRKNTSNNIDPYVGGSPSAIVWTFFIIGWLIAFVLVLFLVYIYFTKRCKGNYQPTDTEDSVFGSNYKPSPHIVQTVVPSENGKPPLMTPLHQSPIKAMPSNGSLPQSRTNSLTPSVEPPYSAPNGRNSSGSYRPNGSFTYGMDTSYLVPRQPTTDGTPSELGRLPSESESRPSASGASDSEHYGDDSDIWLKRSDGTAFGQEHEV